MEMYAPIHPTQKLWNDSANNRLRPRNDGANNKRRNDGTNNRRRNESVPRTPPSTLQTRIAHKRNQRNPTIGVGVTPFIWIDTTLIAEIKH